MASLSFRSSEYWTTRSISLELKRPQKRSSNGLEGGGDGNGGDDAHGLGWRNEEVLALQEQIDARIDLAVRMADEKWRLARNAYDRFDVSIRRLDADLRRMETDLRIQGLLPEGEGDGRAQPRKRRRSGRRAIGESETEHPVLSPSDQDATVVPNEPVYCICMEVSYGEMVGCDNLSCEHGEWFHFECVNLTSRPTGQWLCPGCTAQQQEARRDGTARVGNGVHATGKRAS